MFKLFMFVFYFFRKPQEVTKRIASQELANASFTSSSPFAVFITLPIYVALVHHIIESRHAEDVLFQPLRVFIGLFPPIETRKSFNCLRQGNLILTALSCLFPTMAASTAHPLAISRFPVLVPLPVRIYAPSDARRKLLPMAPVLIFLLRPILIFFFSSQSSFLFPSQFPF